jgi:hypothetical protein
MPMPLFTLFAIILFNVLSILKTSCQEYVIILIVSVLFKFMVFIESKTTHVIYCITVHYFSFSCYSCEWLCKLVTCYNVKQCPHHIYPYSTGVYCFFFLHNEIILIVILRNESGGMQVGLAPLQRLSHVLITYASIFCCTVIVHVKS